MLRLFFYIKLHMWLKLYLSCDKASLEFSGITRYIANMQNSVAFIYTDNIQLEDVMEGKTLFTIVAR